MLHLLLREDQGMTVTDTEIDIKAIEHLDFEESKKCEMIIHDVGCPERALWLVTMKCCGEGAQLCTPHKDYMVGIPRTARRKRNPMVCSACGHEFHHKTPPSKIFTVTPLS